MTSSSMDGGSLSWPWRDGLCYPCCCDISSSRVSVDSCGISQSWCREGHWHCCSGGTSSCLRTWAPPLMQEKSGWTQGAAPRQASCDKESWWSVAPWSGGSGTWCSSSMHEPWSSVAALTWHSSSTREPWMDAATGIWCSSWSDEPWLSEVGLTGSGSWTGEPWSTVVALTGPGSWSDEPWSNVVAVTGSGSWTGEPWLYGVALIGPDSWSDEPW